MVPFVIGWQHGDLKNACSLGVYAPTGEFDKGHLANVGKNYWTFEPSASLSYLSSKIGLELSGFVGADLNTTNDRTDYHSGEQFHASSTVAQHLPLGRGFVGVGANSFYYQQIGSDSGDGARLGSFKGRTIGIGPVLSYAMKIRDIQLVAEAKWLPELEVENRLEGDIVWTKLLVVF